MTIKELEKNYPKFVYENYSWKISDKGLEIFFDFKVEPDIAFRPKITIVNIEEHQIKRMGESVLRNFIFHLGLIEMISYWKAFCSPLIEIRAGFLDPKQIKWWQGLIKNGLGQFFYENKLKFLTPKLINASLEKVPGALFVREQEREGVLVPMGGGKDSIVTLEILKEAKKEVKCFSLNPGKASLDVMETGECRSPVTVIREMDKKLLELNQKGFLNGHTPFSAYLAFLSLLSSALFDYKYIAFSNERSSNEGNVKYLGKEVNHQWSKSFEFEKSFREYSKKYLASNIEYFSFLRPLYEIQIARLFSQHKKYFPFFLSCNEAQKTNFGTKRPGNKWCGNCSKCLFAWVSLYPFIEEKELIEIFGGNLFANESLLPIMQELIGEKGFKPFECVGTKKESLTALYLSWKKKKEEPSSILPFLLDYFEKEVLPRHSGLSKDAAEIMRSWNGQYFLPKGFEKIVIDKFNNSIII